MPRAGVGSDIELVPKVRNKEGATGACRASQMRVVLACLLECGTSKQSSGGQDVAREGHIIQGYVLLSP